MKRFLPILFCAILLVAIQPSGAAQSATERDSATVRLYRISTFFADQLIFDVYLGDATIYRAVVGTRTELKVPADSKLKLVAKKDKSVSITFTPTAGAVCYVRCEAAVKGSGSQPKLTLMETAQGAQEFESIKADILPAVAPKQEKVAASSAILAIADNRFSPRFSVAVLGGYFTGSGLLYWNNADLNMNGWHLGLDARYNVTDAWSVGLLFDQHQCAFTPSDRMFSAGPLVSTRRYFGSEQHDYLEGGLAFCYLHLNKQTKHYNVVANNFMPMILFNYSVKVSDWLSATPGVRIGISAIHKFSTVDDDGGRSLVDRYGTIGFNFTCVEFSLAFQFSFK